MGDEKPSNFSDGRALEVSGEPAAPAEPCKGTLDDPAFGQKLEAFDPGWSLDNLDCPMAAMGESVDELCAAINAVGKDMSKLGKSVAQALQQRDRTMDILNVGGMDVDGQEKTVGIGDNVPLTPMDALAGVEATWASSLRR